MIPWVVIDRRYLRQSRQSCALPRLFLCNIPTCKPSNIPTFGFPYLLPSSVSRKSCTCHSYENCRGVYQQFPFWLALSRAEGFTQERSARREHSPLATRRSFTPVLSGSLATFLQLLSFQTLAHSFALTKNSTRFFSSDSELFAKNHPGWGGGSTRHNPVPVVSCA
jgi:hypothetical protein